MDKTKFSFDLVDKYTPEDVIKKSLVQINDATQGYVKGNIEEYCGPIRSYTKQTGLAATLSSIQTKSETIKVDIQEDLGEQSKEDHRYEVFLTVKGLEHYRYRLMFVDYGAISYPVTIVLNEMLAIEYSGKRNDIYYIDSMKELENMLDVVINSESMIDFIQKLINESLRQERVEKVVIKDETLSEEQLITFS